MAESNERERRGSEPDFAGDVYVNEVAAGVLLYRLLTWILLIPVGLVALGGWRVQQRRKVTDAIA